MPDTTEITPETIANAFTTMAPIISALNLAPDITSALIDCPECTLTDPLCPKHKKVLGWYAQSWFEMQGMFTMPSSDEVEEVVSGKL